VAASSIYKEREMEESLKDQLLSIAREQLASSQVAVLQNLFTENTDLQMGVEERDKHIGVLDDNAKNNKDTIADLRDLLKKAEANNIKQANLDARESEVQKRELRQEINDLKVAAMSDKAQTVERMFTTVFANSVLKRTVLGGTDFNNSYTDENGMYRTSNKSVNRSEDETVTEEG